MLGVFGGLGALKGELFFVEGGLGSTFDPINFEGPRYGHPTNLPVLWIRGQDHGAHFILVLKS